MDAEDRRQSSALNKTISSPRSKKIIFVKISPRIIRQRLNLMIRVGIGGWTYEPWRGAFYPRDLAHVKELEYASRHLTSIEINSTYYGTQKAETFARWRDATPAGFVFSVKGSR